MILQGSLGHPWFPEPSELRMTCEKAMQPVREEMRHIARRREIDRQNAEFRPIRPKTAAELERHAALMADFNVNFKSDRDKKEEMEREEIRARYGMTEDVMAKIKDAPKHGRTATEIFKNGN